MVAVPARPQTFDRFHENLEVDPETGCWLWTGKRLSTNGYGRWRWMGREIAAHRFAYELYVGPIPRRMELDHTCARWSEFVHRRVVNRRCCNPAHLKPVTKRVNILLSANPTAINARKEFCKNGHPFSGPGSDVRITPAGRRECRICRRDYCAARRSKSRVSMKAEVIDAEAWNEGDDTGKRSDQEGG